MSSIFFTKKAASSDSTVLITGESGTGKELVARSIHCLSERRDSPFVPVNCGAIPESLIESELFGYEQGAFTGARKGGKPGLFEVAHGGSIFLDEITELALHLQGKLHRVLQEMTITRVGANLSKQVDVRVIAASNRDLKELLHHNEFREDLYYRLNVVPIHIPPLRERIEDIPLLVNFFLEKFRGIFSREIAGVTRELMDFFMGYSWPGNIRQLENFIEYGVNFCEGDTLDLKTMTPHIQGYEKDFSDQLHVPYKADNETLSTSLLEMEANKLVEALRECGCSFEGKKLVAARLGVSQATLYRKLKRHGLTRLGEKAEATVDSIRNDKGLEEILNIDNDDQTGMPPALPGDSRGFDRLRRQR